MSPGTRISLAAVALALVAGGFGLLQMKDGDGLGPAPVPRPDEVATTPEPAVARRAAPLDPGTKIELGSPEELRAFKRRCDEALVADAPWLRQLALNHDDPLVAGQAIQALGRLHLFGNDAAYLRLLDDERPRVRHESVRALGLCGDQAVTGALTPLLAQADATERALAIQALGRLPGRSAREALEAYEASGEASETELAFLRAALDPEPMRVGQRQGTDDGRLPVSSDG